MKSIHRFLSILVLGNALALSALGGTAGCGSGAPAAQCGDGTVSGSEVCDGGALNGATCESRGFSSEGSLGCAADCGSFDTSACVASGTVSGLTFVSGDGDDFIYASPDSLGNLYFTSHSASTSVTAGGLTVTNTLANGHYRPVAGKLTADGSLAWFEGFQGNGTSDDQGVDFAFDPSGNPIIGGSFYGTSLAAPGKAVANVDGTGLSSDSYMGLLNPDGSLAWFNSFASSEGDQEFFQFGPSGDLYVDGFFTGTSLQVGGKTLTNADGSGNSNDKFIGKMNPEDGSFLWVTSFASDDYDNAFLSFDASGSLYVIGNFSGTNLAVDGVNQMANASPGKPDAFAARLDPDTGKLLWLTGFSSNGFDSLNSNGEIHPAGHFTVYGQFFGATLTAGSKTLTNADGGGTTDDAFVASLDLFDGSVSWLTAVSSDKNDSARLTTDVSGKLYVTGSFTGPMLSLGGNTLANADSSGTTSDDYLVRLDPSDGTALWLVGVSSDGNDLFNPFLATDPKGFLYFDSFFSGATLTVGGQTFANTDTSGNSIDGFLAKFDPEGGLVWLTQIEGAGDDFLNLTADLSNHLASDKIYVDGNFTSLTSTLAGETFTNADSSGKTRDAFVGRINPEDGKLVWTIPVSSDGDDGAGLIPDKAGNLFVSGAFRGTSLTIADQTFTNADSSGKTRDGFVGRIAP